MNDAADENDYEEPADPLPLPVGRILSVCPHCYKRFPQQLYWDDNLNQPVGYCPNCTYTEML